MNTIRTRTVRAASVTALSTAAVLGFAGLAHADNIQDTIADDGSGLTLVAGSGTAQTAGIRVVATGGDGDEKCNYDEGENPLVLDLVTPKGVTANPDPLEIRDCNEYVSVSFTADSTAESGLVTATIVSRPAGDAATPGSYKNEVEIPITVTRPATTNTAPSVAVTGVADGAKYEFGKVPDAGCEASDKEDGTIPAIRTITGVTGLLSEYGLGMQTVSCETTDSGKLTAAASATYEIADTGKPTITHTLAPATPNTSGWYNQDVKVDFTCADNGAGIDDKDCVGDTTLTDGRDQSVTGTATDVAGNTATDTVSGINIDTKRPSVEFSGGPVAGTYYYGSVSTAPACVASDALSGLDGDCSVTGGGNTVGTHAYTAKATDKAGNTQEATMSYTVLPWRTAGFYAPVDMGGTLNTVKGGSTVPMKFEIFAGDAELTSTSAVTKFSAVKVNCSTTAPLAEVEVVTSGSTALRYDSTGGQFIQNWQTPKTPGVCYQATVSTEDGATTSALFQLK